MADLKDLKLEEEERVISLQCLTNEVDLIPDFDEKSKKQVLEQAEDRLTKSYMQLSFVAPFSERIKVYRQLFIGHIIVSCMMTGTSSAGYELNILQAINWMSEAHGRRWCAQILALKGLLSHFTALHKPLHVARVWHRINRLKKPTPSEDTNFPLIAPEVSNLRNIRLWRTCTRLIKDGKVAAAQEFWFRHFDGTVKYVGGAVLGIKVVLASDEKWDAACKLYDKFISDCRKLPVEHLNKIGRTCGRNPDAPKKAQQALIEGVIDKFAPKEKELWDLPFKLGCSRPGCLHVESQSQEFELCSKCCLAKYCSKECQRQHRATHRRECKPLFG